MLRALVLAAVLLPGRWSAAELAPVLLEMGHTDLAIATSFHPGAPLFLSGGNRAVLWSAVSCAPLAIFDLRGADVSRLGWLSDGSLFASKTDFVPPRRSAFDPTRESYRGRVVKVRADELALADPIAPPAARAPGPDPLWPACERAERSPDGKRVACHDRATRRLRVIDVVRKSAILGPSLPSFAELRWAGDQVVALQTYGPEFLCIDSRRGTITGEGRGAVAGRTVSANGAFVRMRTYRGNPTVFTFEGARLTVQPELREVEDWPEWRVFHWETPIDERAESISPDATLEVLRARDGTVRIASVVDTDERGEPKTLLQLPTREIDGYFWIAPDLLVMNSARAARLWSAHDPGRVRSLSARAPAFAGAAAVNQWRAVFTDGVTLFDGRRLWPLPTRALTNDSAFDPGGRFFALVEAREEEDGLHDPSVTFYDLKGGAPRRLRVTRKPGLGWVAPGRFAFVDAVIDLPSESWLTQTVTAGCYAPRCRFSRDGRFSFCMRGVNRWFTLCERGREVWSAEDMRCIDDCAFALIFGYHADRLLRTRDGQQLTIHWLLLGGMRFEPLVISPTGKFDVAESAREVLWLTDDKELFRADLRPSLHEPDLIHRFLQ